MLFLQKWHYHCVRNRNWSYQLKHSLMFLFKTFPKKYCTFCLSSIFMAKCWPVSLCLTSMTRPNEPVPKVFKRSKWSNAAVCWGVEEGVSKRKGHATTCQHHTTKSDTSVHCSSWTIPQLKSTIKSKAFLKQYKCECFDYSVYIRCALMVAKKICVFHISPAEGALPLLNKYDLNLFMGRTISINLPVRVSEHVQTEVKSIQDLLQDASSH